MVTSSVGYLLDTNAISELIKTHRDQAFIEWFTTCGDERLFLSCLSLGESRKGIRLLNDVARRKRLEKFLTELTQSFGGRILGIDNATALLWGDLTAGAQRNGRAAPAIDSLLAAQAIMYNLVLVTRNTRDFEQFTGDGLQLFSPWG